jgi:pimeloyl-ACP methyl ester carboxylesterase
MRRHSLRANGRQVWGLKPYVTRMAEEYPKLNLPVEILHGTADTTVPADIHAIPLSRLLPDAQLTLLPDVAHMPHHTNPEAVIDAIHRAATRAGLR